MSGIGTKRKFRGKSFRYDSRHLHKRWAQEQKVRLKRAGLLVRIVYVNTRFPWEVYVFKKGW